MCNRSQMMTEINGSGYVPLAVPLMYCRDTWMSPRGEKPDAMMTKFPPSENSDTSSDVFRNPTVVYIYQT